MAKLSRNFIDRTRSVVKYVERHNRSRVFPRARPPVQTTSGLVVKINEDIAAVAGATPGQGEATVWVYDADGNLQETDRVITLYNFLDITFTFDNFVGVSNFGGHWSPVIWSCPT